MDKQKETKKAKDKGIRHTRAIALDRSKHQPAIPPPQQIEKALNDVIDPTYLASFIVLKVRSLSLGKYILYRNNLVMPP